MKDTKTNNKLKKKNEVNNSFSILNKKLLLIIVMFLINLVTVSADLLDDATTGARFATFGVFIIIMVFILNEIIKMFKKKK